MESEQILIELYDKRQDIASSIYVTKLSDNVFRMIENDILNCRLTLETEFETRINKNGKHEIIRIVKDSPFNTRRFMLTQEFVDTGFKALGDKIIENGGFWEIVFGGIAIINLPIDTDINFDDLFKFVNYYPTEIKD